ncbi:HAD family hydrolase [Jeotgalibaca porci]|uniref:HAD family hydrolase n=1 Tax=Jeotgalibaca porci TaxID=1868793 RepID=UPI00359FEB3A
MKKQVIIFDMDGLMFDTEVLVCEAQAKIAEKLGVPFSMEYYRGSVGLSEKDCMAKYTKDFGDPAIAEELIFGYRDTLYQMVAEKGVPHKPGLVPLLDHLTSLGKELVLASSNLHHDIALYLEAENLSHYFSHRVSGEDVTFSKPDPAIFEKACALTGYQKEDCLILEDSLNGVRAAHAAGIAVIMVPDLIAPNHEARDKTFAIVNNLSEVQELF